MPDQNLKSKLSERLGALSNGAAGRVEEEWIRDALGRIERGHYGVCHFCAGDIEPARLEKSPHAIFCETCAGLARHNG